MSTNRKTLFFAAASTQRRYFETVVITLKNSSSIWYKSIPFWPFTFLNHPALATIIAGELRKSANIKGQPEIKLIRWGHRLLLAIYARHLLARYSRYLQNAAPEVSVVWNGLKFRQEIWCLAANNLNIKLHYMENGLIAGYTTLDAQGVNFGNSLPRDAEFYRQYAIQQNLKVSTDALPLRNEPFKDITSLPTGRYVFIPLQVNGDSQIVRYSPWVQNMAHLSDIVIECLPVFNALNLNVVIKPHPKCSTPNQGIIKKLKAQGISVVTDVDSKTLVANAEAVMTVNSTVGLEALQAGVKTIVMGEAFYNMPSMTFEARSTDELKSRLKQLANWQPDELAIVGLFEYMAQHYQVKGEWREANAEHLTVLQDKLLSMGVS